MDRRKFLRNLAVTSAAIKYLPDSAKAAAFEGASSAPEGAIEDFLAASSTAADIEGHTQVCEFKIDATSWKVYEDLRTRDGVLTFVSSTGGVRVMPKSAEASFDESATPYLGLKLADIGNADSDLLADKILEGGKDPDPEMVKAAAPPLGPSGQERGGWRLPWDTFVGTKECSDTMPVMPGGSTRTYHSGQYFPEINGQAVKKRFDGLIGGWMPAVRKVIPTSDTAYVEVVVFGDVEARDKFIVQTWHRTSQIEGGKIVKVVYGYSYPDFPPRRQEPRCGAVLSRASNLRRLLGKASHRFRAHVAPAECLGRYVEARLREGVDGSPVGLLSQVRRCRSRLLRLRIRWLPGHFHDGRLRQSRMWPLRSGPRHH